ncbi:TRAP transporter substrate-binding protein DctP [Acuticoccus sediminis]|nr:TRAP transporter substrate-binding protein DctP [Acuticoccus sediminis]
MTTRLFKTGAIAGAALWLSVLPGQAETLRMGDSFPVGHYISENLAKFFMDDVKDRSGGEIDFEYFPAQQMGKAKDMLQLTQSGVLDIGYVAPSYISDKLPLSAVAELPEAFSSACEGTKAFWKLVKPGGLLDEVEIAPNGMRVLMVLVLPPYQIFTKDRDITGLDSFKGLKLRTTGGAKEIATQRIEAVPVQIPAPEVRDSLSRGTLDALLFPVSSILPYDVQSYLHQATTNQNFGSFVIAYMISKQKWDSLSPETQQVLTESGEAATAHSCADTDALEDKDRQTITEAGVEFVTLPDADSEKIKTLMAGVGDEWAEELEGRGKPGRAVLDGFRANLKAGD